MKKEELDVLISKLNREEQKWLFHRIMWRLWPSTAGRSVILGEKVGVFREEEDQEVLQEYKEIYEQAVAGKCCNSKDTL